MCLILLSFEQHPRYRLVVAANRDEFLARPARPAAVWEDAGGMVAGKDLQAGGAWLGVGVRQRWAAVTNYRDRTTEKPKAPSRGRLVRDYLAGSMQPDAYVRTLERRAGAYSGYNLLVGDEHGVWWLSNIQGKTRALKPGLHGLSNRFLNTPWPKVTRGKARLAEILDTDMVDPDRVFDMLKDETQAPDEQLPDTGVGLEWERRLSPMFIASPDYGTRCSSLILIHRSGEVELHERTYPTDGGSPFDVYHRIK